VGERVPIRTCVGCRTRSPKIELLRVVKGREGPTLDAAGSGRGAYVHRRSSCVDALRVSSLARALRTRLTDDEVGRLRASLRMELGAL
jgi:predicted RNA-binding protein YlxR (DUF448 family)